MKTLSSHCKGSDSAPGQGSKLSHAMGHGQEQNNRKSASVHETDVEEQGKDKRRQQGRAGLAAPAQGWVSRLPFLRNSTLGHRVFGAWDQPQHKRLHFCQPQTGQLRACHFLRKPVYLCTMEWTQNFDFGWLRRSVWKRDWVWFGTCWGYSNNWK